MAEMWEILIPTASNAGVPYDEGYHRAWEKRVYEITGGLTTFVPCQGKWINESGILFEESMIPVRISCTEEQINTIIDFTITYYDQEAVMAYKVSDEVIIKHRT